MKKYDIQGVPITKCTYEEMVKEVLKAYKKRSNLYICPIASQTIFLAAKSNDISTSLAQFHHIVPCSQWVRRSMNILHNAGIKKRVYGPNLMLQICRMAVNEKINIFLYGTTKKTVKNLSKELKLLYPGINIVGAVPSKFSDLTTKEKTDLKKQIKKSKTHILFLGLGSPLQELFAYDLFFSDKKFNYPLILLTVGASFDFIGKSKPQAPIWVQNLGMEWFFRLLCEPRRLMKRHLVYSSGFMLGVLKKKLTDTIINSLN